MRIHTGLTPIAFSALVALAGGCATVPRAPSTLDTLTKLENLPGKPGCFRKSDFQGDWTVLNDTTLIVRAPLPKDAYVIKLFAPVTDLSFMQHLGFEDRERTDRICNDTSDDLVVPGPQRRTSIVAVHALTADEQDQLLRAAGKQGLQRNAGAQPAVAGS